MPLRQDDGLHAQSSLTLDGRDFLLIGCIAPERNPNGALWLHRPQEKYAKAAITKLHRYGDGQFCKFALEDASECAGVYVMRVKNAILYVGESKKLRRRFNSGYGNISPKNCFVGGRQTNCRINKLVRNVLQEFERLEVWFCECDDRKALEKRLMRSLAPAWNLESIR